ncbi:MAG: hypothetical protein EP338_04345 [Bacteroidetes bacterium]|nr:MAG: hypothetical protein EP338_04345 [Bacteroidota bacterium]
MNKRGLKKLSVLLCGIIVLFACARKTNLTTVTTTEEKTAHLDSISHAQERADSLIPMELINRSKHEIHKDLAPDYYALAFKRIQSLIRNPAKESFKEALFHMENAFHNGSLDRKHFEAQLQNLLYLAELHKQSHAEVFLYQETDQEQMLKHASLFHLITDTLRMESQGVELQHLPFLYDHEQAFDSNRWDRNLVSKLLNSKKGNCQALVYLYKMLADAWDVPSHLALAPHHIYLKHSAKATGMFNTELTSASFPSDGWIMSSGYISLKAVQSGIYMKALSKQEEISLVLLDLAQAYHFQRGMGDGQFILSCCEEVLKNFPNCINARLLKAKVLFAQLKIDPDLALKKEHEELIRSIYQLGFREVPQKMYESWISHLRQPEHGNNH